jgi:hypothetical protein
MLAEHDRGLGMRRSENASRVQHRKSEMRLVHLVVGCGGSFYLTYAPELVMACLIKAYSEIDAVFRMKHAIDPDNRFTSRFFERHGKRERAKTAASGR